MSSSAAQQPDTKSALPAMGFLQHLEELRQRLIKSVLFIIAGFAVCWNFHDRIWTWIQEPIVKALSANHFDTTLVYTNPTEPFNIFLKVALIAGIFVSSPFVLYQVWAFIAPGLYRNEKRYVLPFMFSTVGLFVGGGLFGYYMVYPGALTFLIEFSKQLKPMITIGEYLDLFMTIILGLGIVFEMPIIVFFLSLFGLVSAGWMWRNLRYSILVIFVVAAIITPTTDIMNMCVFAAPMIILYIVSIGIAFFVHPKRRNRKKVQEG
jgi:sec-independent protein translocase protein TatC